MIGVVLTGGYGTRLKPITNYVNKCILPIGEKPMVYYPLVTLANSGITKVVIVLGGKFPNQVREVVRGLKLSLQITYVYQKLPLGMADAIRSSHKAVGDSPISVIAGDNVYGGNFKKTISSYRTGEISFLKRVADPERFAIGIYRDKVLVDILEKPQNPENCDAIIGPHIFDSNVFSYIEDLDLSPRGEYELVDLHRRYLQEGKLKLVRCRFYWQDVGTPKSLFEAAKKLEKYYY